VHLGLNLIYLVPGETGGMETYARGLIPALLGERPELRISAFVNHETFATGDGPWTELVEPILVPVRARRRAEWVRGEQTLLPRLAGRAEVDVVHSLGSTAPAWGGFKRIVTIHDLIYRIYPSAHSHLRSIGMRALVPMAARRSERILVPSECTKSDLIHLLHVPPEKVDVVPLGLSPAAAVPSGEADVRARYELRDRIVALTASAKRPHKNLTRLIEAWALITPDRRPILVLPGYATEHETELRAHAQHLGVASDTRFLGWVPDADLEALYGIAQCFVFPSLYEGFGLPVLEAMGRGVPVATSDRASLPEVAGDAARFFDPESPQSIADAVLEILADRHLADLLRAAGLERASRFTWSSTARRTLGAYDRVAMDSGPARR
jgi:glycosyltransferase involved in cell wall biosynthesis